MQRLLGSSQAIGRTEKPTRRCDQEGATSRWTESHIYLLYCYVDEFVALTNNESNGSQPELEPLLYESAVLYFTAAIPRRTTLSNASLDVAHYYSISNIAHKSSIVSVEAFLNPPYNKR